MVTTDLSQRSSIGYRWLPVFFGLFYVPAFPLWSNDIWLVVSNIWISFHFIYGMSSFPLTNSYFRRGRSTTNQTWYVCFSRRRRRPVAQRQTCLDHSDSDLFCGAEAWSEVGIFRAVEVPWISPREIGI